MKTTPTQAPLDDLGKALGHTEIQVWALQLHIMLSAGLPLLMSLESIAKSELPRLAWVCNSLAARISAGKSLSEAMNDLGSTFSKVVVNLVKIGEGSGRLVAVLLRISQRASRQEKLDREIKSGLTYPLFLAAVSVGMALFMALYMFPRLLPFLSGLGVILPWPTRVMMWLTANVGPLFLLLTVVAMTGLRLLFSSYDARVEGARQWLQYHLPVIGDLNRNRVYADFLSDLCLLLETGCDFVESLRAIHVPWPDQRRRVLECVEGICAGQDLCEAVQSSEMLPSQFLLQIRSGEESGKLVPALKQISRYLDETVSHRMAQLVQFLEPTILLVMGCIVGFVVLATFLPLYSMLSVSL